MKSKHTKVAPKVRVGRCRRTPKGGWSRATIPNIMVATPTHSAKHYAAAHLVKYTDRAFPVERRRDGWWVVAANSKEFNWAPFHRVSGIEMVHLRDLPSDHYECKGAIHRRVVTTMNQMRELFLISSFQWFLSLESDVLLTVNQVNDMIARVNENRIVCLHTNCYVGFNKSPTFTKTTRLTLGCTLIHRSIIEQFEFKYNPDILAAFHDALLITDMTYAGIPAHYDPNVKPVHLCEKRDDKGVTLRGWQNLPKSEL